MSGKVSAAEAGLASRLRRQDPDRFLLTLFAPAAQRDVLLLLIAFNNELVRALALASAHGEAGPVAPLIRLQWWREVVEGATRRHELAAPLGEAVQAGVLPRARLLELIEARESEAEGFQGLQDWRAAQLAGPGALQVAIGEVLGETDPLVLHRLRALGAAYGCGAMLRHRAAILASGRAPFPPQDADGAATRAAGLAWLAEAGGLRGAASLPGVLARRDLARPVDAGTRRRGVGDLLALLLGSLRRDSLRRDSL